MTDCPDGVIRDQLPEYVHGVLGAADAARVETHLAGCADCRAELGILMSARALADLRTPVLDLAALKRAIPSAPPRLATARRSRSWSRVWQYAAAAAVLLAVSSTAMWKSGADASAPQRVADSSAAVVTAPTQSAPTAAVPVSSEGGVSFGGGLSDLSVSDLEALLGQMDSVKTLPSTDPESMTPVIAVKEGGKSL